ncbi:outer membrane beta-barrel protein [Spirosoma lituiforme]
MKTRLILLLLTLAPSLISQAQTQKGRWTIGAELGNLTYQHQDQFNSFKASLTPAAGYFITNGLVLGAGLPISGGTQKSEYVGYYFNKSSNFTIGLSPFARYYFGKTNLKPYLGFAYSYSGITGKVESNDTAGMNTGETKGHSSMLMPTLGLAYFVNSTIALALNLNYNVSHLEETTTNTQYAPGSYISDTRNLSLGIGFQLFLGK